MRRGGKERTFGVASWWSGSLWVEMGTKTETAVHLSPSSPLAVLLPAPNQRKRMGMSRAGDGVSRAEMEGRRSRAAMGERRRD
jgi:hypothetical protein